MNARHFLECEENGQKFIAAVCDKHRYYLGCRVPKIDIVPMRPEMKLALEIHES